MSLLSILLFTLSSLLPSAQKAEIVFAGDAMQHKAQLDAAYDRNDKSYNYHDCFIDIEPYLTTADYAVVNLETPVGVRPYTGYPCFSAPESYVDALAFAGFDMMLTANNHTLDKRDRGLLKTLDALDSRQLAHLGTYRNKSERDSLSPLIVPIKGFKVAFLNYTYGTNGIEIQGEPIVNYINREKIRDEIRQSRKEGAEIVVVCLHWGNEYELLPTKSQISLAEFLSEQGVDAIIGSHPHVIQPMEMRTNSDGKPMLLVYSLGNFISNMKTRDTRGGAMVRMTLSRDSLGKAQVEGANYRLVFTIPGNAGDNYKVVPVEQMNHPLWKSHAGAFERSAENIFRKHNKNVPRDTVPIISKKITGAEIFLRKRFCELQK